MHCLPLPKFEGEVKKQGLGEKEKIKARVESQIKVACVIFFLGTYTVSSAKNLRNFTSFRMSNSPKPKKRTKQSRSTSKQINFKCDT